MSTWKHNFATGLITPPPPIWQRVTGVQAFMFCWSVALVLITTGWLAIPAKQSELTALAGEVSGLRDDIKAVAGEVQTMASEIQRNREELIRLGATVLLPRAPQKQIVRAKKPPMTSGSFSTTLQ